MKSSLRRIAVLLTFFTIHASAFALDCDQAQTQAGLNECAGQALSQADAELNRTYLAYRNGLDKARQDQIRDVQLAWIKYRDLSCRYVGSGSAGGSAHGMVLQSCLTTKTQERTAELKALSTCPEGDLACAH